MKEPKPWIHDGKVVYVDGDQLTTTCNEGWQHCHTIPKGTRVTVSGRVGKLADLKTGVHVRVTTTPDDKTTATSVETGATA